jgi:hypothetical protein
MYRSIVRRRRIAAGLVLSALAAGGFAAGLAAAGDERPGAAPAFVQSDELPDGGQDGWRRALASRFDDYGAELACGGVLERDELGVASRTLPCGTPVTFAYRGRVVTVPVIDRGPYVAGREWDLTGATAEALAFPGLATVAWRR